MLLSVETKAVTETQGYQDLKANLSAAQRADADKMLAAAANGTPYHPSMAQGTIIFTSDNCKKVLAKLSASRKQIDVLTDPTWPPPNH